VESTHVPNIEPPQITLDKYNEAYKNVYTLCTQRSLGQVTNSSKRPEALVYEMVEEALTKYYEKTVLGAVLAKSGVLRLIELARRQKSAHESIGKWLTKFLPFIERTFCSNHSKPTIKEMGMYLMP
jgi:hypothetical protein